MELSSLTSKLNPLSLFIDWKFLSLRQEVSTSFGLAPHSLQNFVVDSCLHFSNILNTKWKLYKNIWFKTISHFIFECSNEITNSLFKNLEK